MFIILGSNSDVPLYEQIAIEVKAKILAGELKPGDPLPSIRQLASELLISVITTKRAYQELESGGFIETRPGKGTFVSDTVHASPIDRRVQEVKGQLQEAIRIALRIGLSPTELSDLFKQIICEEVST